MREKKCLVTRYQENQNQIYTEVPSAQVSEAVRKTNSSKSQQALAQDGPGVACWGKAGVVGWGVERGGWDRTFHIAGGNVTKEATAETSMEAPQILKIEL